MTILKNVFAFLHYLKKSPLREKGKLVQPLSFTFSHCFLSIISTLPEANHLLLKGFICTLHHIAEHAHTNGMNPFNLGLCVSNSLFKTETTTIRSGKQEADVMSSVVEFLIQNCSTLFGSDILTCIPDKRILIHEVPNRSKIKQMNKSFPIGYLMFRPSKRIVNGKSR